MSKKNDIFVFCVVLMNTTLKSVDYKSLPLY